MLLKVLNKKVSLFTMALMIISISIVLLTLGYLLGTNLSFLLGFATSTLLLGFGMLIISLVSKLKSGKVPETKFDEREKSIAYIAGFTSYIITIFALCIFTFVAFSSKITIDITITTLSTVTLLFMSICFFASMLIFKKTL